MIVVVVRFGRQYDGSLGIALHVSPSPASGRSRVSSLSLGCPSYPISQAYLSIDSFVISASGRCTHGCREVQYEREDWKGGIILALLLTANTSSLLSLTIFSTQAPNTAPEKGDSRMAIGPSPGLL